MSLSEQDQHAALWLGMGIILICWKLFFFFLDHYKYGKVYFISVLSYFEQTIEHYIIIKLSQFSTPV